MPNPTHKEFYHPSQTADVIPYRFVDGRLQILLVRRSDSAKAFPGAFALPGGFMDSSDPDVFHAAARELKEETGLVATRFHFVGVFTAKGRDPRGPVHSVAVTAPVPPDALPKAGDDASDAVWFGARRAKNTVISLDGDSETWAVSLYNSEHHIVFGLDFAVSPGDFGIPRITTAVSPVCGFASLAFDHAQILAHAFAAGAFRPDAAKKGA